MRKLAQVLDELKEKEQKRNCIAEVIEDMQINYFRLQLSFGRDLTDGFKLEVPEMVISDFKGNHRDFIVYEKAKNLYLENYKNALTEVMKAIDELELEKANILNTLAAPLNESENE